MANDTPVEARVRFECFGVDAEGAEAPPGVHVVTYEIPYPRAVNFCKNGHLMTAFDCLRFLIVLKK